MYYSCYSNIRGVTTTSDKMLPIANKYTLAQEASIDTRDQKKDMEQGHSDQPNTSKNNDKKRHLDRSVANVESLKVSSIRSASTTHPGLRLTVGFCT
jgi:hypothetical protein